MSSFLQSTLIAIATIGSFTGPLVTASHAQATVAKQTQNKGGDFTKKKYKV